MDTAEQARAGQLRATVEGLILAENKDFSVVLHEHQPEILSAGEGTTSAIGLTPQLIGKAATQVSL